MKNFICNTSSRGGDSADAKPRAAFAAGFFGQLSTVAAWPLVGLIWVYQKAISPSIPAFFGPTCSCRYYPTCSHYAAESLRVHGIFVGTFLAVRRLLRCTPFHRGGIDPVPARGVIRRICQRATKSPVHS